MLIKREKKLQVVGRLDRNVKMMQHCATRFIDWTWFCSSRFIVLVTVGSFVKNLPMFAHLAAKFKHAKAHLTSSFYSLSALLHQVSRQVASEFQTAAAIGLQQAD